MEGEFGEGYARTLSRDHVVGALGERTPDQALADGVPPRAVWLALVQDVGVPESRWLGADEEPMDVPQRVIDSIGD